MSPALFQATNALLATTGELAAEAPPAEWPAAALNSFGTLFMVVSWALLIGLNLWCFRRLLAGPRGRARQA